MLNSVFVLLFSILPYMVAEKRFNFVHVPHEATKVEVYGVSSNNGQHVGTYALKKDATKNALDLYIGLPDFDAAKLMFYQNVGFKFISEIMTKTMAHKEFENYVEKQTALDVSEFAAIGAEKRIYFIDAPNKITKVELLGGTVDKEDKNKVDYVHVGTYTMEKDTNHPNSWSDFVSVPASDANTLIKYDKVAFKFLTVNGANEFWPPIATDGFAKYVDERRVPFNGAIIDPAKRQANVAQAAGGNPTVANLPVPVDEHHGHGNVAHAATHGNPTGAKPPTGKPHTH